MAPSDAMRREPHKNQHLGDHLNNRVSTKLETPCLNVRNMKFSDLEINSQKFQPLQVKQKFNCIHTRSYREPLSKFGSQEAICLKQSNFN